MRHVEKVTDVYHHLVSRHQVEIEVWPARIELNFHDERSVNPINTQTRFEATIYNSGAGVLWEVRDIDGSAGNGSIDASGLYSTPNKGTLPSGLTEIVIATAREDPLRKAYAWVTLVGLGPEPVPSPTVDIAPKHVNLYYPFGFNNNYMDDCNKMRLFKAVARNSTSSAIEWLVDGVVQPGTSPWFLYKVNGSGSTKVVTVRARLQGQAAIFEDAQVLQLNYVWPGA